MRRTSLCLLLLLGVLSLWLARPFPAQAHGTLLFASPPDCATAAPSNPVDCRTGQIFQEAPTLVKLAFTEPVKPIRHGLIVTGPDGQAVEQGAIAVSGADVSIAIDAHQPGTYQVSWQVISQDSHPVRGTYNFSVGQPSEIVQRAAWSGSDVGGVSLLGLVLQVMGRLAHFAGYALAFGPFFFEWLVLPPGDKKRPEATLPRLKVLTYSGIGLLLVAEPVGLLGQSASLANEQLFNPDVLADILASSFGQVMTERLGAAILLWVLLGNDRQGKLLKWGITALYLGLALVDGQTSHAVISDSVWLGLPANTVHLAAMGLWLGGLASLVTAWKTPEIQAQKGGILRRFGQVAGIALAWLVVSGALMAWLRLARPEDLWANLYGQTLLVKLGVLAAVVAIAGFGLKRAGWRQRRWWQSELALLVVIVALAGLLISLPPPR
jgi:copper transport protein